MQQLLFIQIFGKLITMSQAPFNYANTLNKADPALWGMIEQEVVRQHEHIELIASENYTGTGFSAHQQVC